MRNLAFAATLAALTLGACATQTDERPAEFDVIVTNILAPSCATATCHSAMTKAEGLDFSTVAAARESFDARSLAPQTSDPADSQLLRVLTTTGEARMPVDGPLPDADIELIRTWVLNGAPR
ncbi:MAG: hypothetical protein R3B06_26735 [Kofleriaceae bacterium]